MKLLIGGSPCTHWSIAQTKNRETDPSGIGWELFLNFLIAVEKYKPDYFLYENNKSIQEAWESVPERGGYISFQLLDNRKNHYKLANYLTKESRSTMRRYREELGIRGKRYTKSQNMVKPEVTYEAVSASSWRKEPKPSKGAYLYKFDDGATCKTGWHEVTGYPYQEYFEIFNE